MLNPLEKQTGSWNLQKPLIIIMIFVMTCLLGVIVVKGNLIIALGLIFLPGIIIFLNQLFRKPKIGIYSVVILGFFANGLGRYITGVPFGLSIDGILVLTYFAIFFKNFYKKVDWSPAATDATFLGAIWFGYALVELINPEAQSKEAWFYAMRGVALYMFLMIPLVLMLMRDYKDFNRFLYLWGILSMLGTLKGIMQLKLGVDPWEQAWLDGGGAVTHVLFGKLRIFSFFSDAGQFGASQAHAGIVGAIIFLNARKTKERVFFGLMSITGFYGMFISGTRGAMAVPFAGLFLYLLLTRNIKMITIGAILGITVFVFFKYTAIGSGVYAIQRMRTAFDPQDRSLQVRLENQQRLKVYLATRPMGGGIGSAGSWGQRFAPNSFLANVATDSWYVMIWAEQGIIGLYLHVFILAYILGKGAYLSMYRVRDPVLQAKLFAIASGMLGIIGASYANGVLGQIPTAPLIYATMAFMFMGHVLDESIEKEKKLITNKDLAIQ